jgi:2-dehydro-3-deoxyphosphogluconate aldolase/(4S)-4-hydroxy-2-oxoglutarate aldolase
MSSSTITPNEVHDRIADAGLIAILRTRHRPAELATIGEALEDGGIRVVEVTLNSPDSLQSIHHLRSSLPSSTLVGAGTVRTVEDVDAAIDAGAQFLIAPNLSPDALERATNRERLILPGVLTPTEVQRAVDGGCRMVKLFPAEPLGPRYLSALMGPLDDVAFVPTGGITLENVSSFVAAGATALGLGSALVGDTPLSDAELARIRGTASEFVARLSSARRKADTRA